MHMLVPLSHDWCAVVEHVSGKLTDMFLYCVCVFPSILVAMSLIAREVRHGNLPFIRYGIRRSCILSCVFCCS